jgi:hypothetical protein
MEVDKLLIVAHPDDEVLWGGINLLTQPGWFVVCSTHANDPVRSAEFYSTMSYCNVTKYIMFDIKDTYTEDPAVADSLYDGSKFEDAIKQLSKKEWKLVLTHNSDGEYGHEHHKKVHRLVVKHFDKPKFFTRGARLTTAQLEPKRDALLYYRKTQTICKKIFDRRGNTIREPERVFFFEETPFVHPVFEVPKFVHQIWFGNPLDKKSVRYNLMKGVEETCGKEGWGYKIWTNDDLTFENFPLTFEFIQLAMKMGKDLNQSRFAQVADLARYEILHRFGGVYLDSLFEIGSKFLEYIHKHRNYDLIIANEDPCKLKCVGAHGKQYVSNGFFACIPGCIVLKRLLNYDELESIDFDSVYINQTTGPYYFRKGMLPRDKILPIGTTLIYPFMVNDSEYRKGKPNGCITEDDTILHDCLTKRYKKSLTIYHSGFGGSWSW